NPTGDGGSRARTARPGGPRVLAAAGRRPRTRSGAAACAQRHRDSPPGPGHGGPQVSGTDGDVVERVRRRLAVSGAEPTPHTVAEALRVEHQLWGTTTVLAIVEQLRGEVLGAGVLQPLLDLAGVTDVLVNGAEAVYV